MELRTMRMFVEVAREESFSRAAKKLHSTQSTVSKAVKQLEHDLQATLLQRSGGGNRLTDAGKLVYEKAIGMLALSDGLRTELGEMQNLNAGTLRLGLPAMGSSTLFAKWFARYRKRYPGIQVQMVEHGSKHLEKMVSDGELDLAASLLPAPQEFETRSVRCEPIDVLLPKHHPLAENRVVDFKALKQEPFIMYARGFALNGVILNGCRKAGFEPNVVAESSQVDFVVELVAANSGIAFLPRMIAELRQYRHVKRVGVQHPEIFWNMAMIWRRGSYLSEAAKAWLAMADEFKRDAD